MNKWRRLNKKTQLGMYIFRIIGPFGSIFNLAVVLSMSIVSSIVTILFQEVFRSVISITEHSTNCLHFQPKKTSFPRKSQNHAKNNRPFGWKWSQNIPSMRKSIQQVFHRWNCYKPNNWWAAFILIQSIDSLEAFRQLDYLFCSSVAVVCFTFHSFYKAFSHCTALLDSLRFWGLIKAFVCLLFIPNKLFHLGS